MIMTYVRDENNLPIGTIMTLRKNLMAVSVCSKDDRFCKVIGKEKAIENLTHVILKNPTKNNFDADFWANYLADNVMFNYKGKHNNERISKVINAVLKEKDRINKYFKE